jgi:hypothetical protein
MTKVLRAMAVVAVLAFAGTAEAQFALDLKAGYAFPTGNVVSSSVSSTTMSDVWAGSIPLGVDARWRFTPALSAGVYFQFNPAFAGSRFCDAAKVSGASSCSGSDMRLGLEVMYGFNPTGMNPWVSLGTGWQWTNISATIAGTTGGVTFSGWEYFNVQAGVDFPLSKLFALGPYVGYFGGTYTNQSATGDAVLDGPSTIDSSLRSFHGWFQIGAKGTFNF